LFTSRFSIGLLLLEYTKGFKRQLCRNLHGTLCRCGDPFWKNISNRLKWATVVKRWLAVFIVTCASWSSCWVGPLLITQCYCLPLFLTKRAIARRSSIGVIYVFAGGFDILIFYKNPLIYGVSHWGLRVLFERG